MFIPSSARHPSAGFTLIELSIVLVIIGLIVGGILVGRDMIKSEQLRAVITQKSSFEIAAKTFRLKYNCNPGDCPTATNFFPGTTNGNNDSQVDFAALSERFIFWQHLSLAGLIPGTYTGTATNNNSNPGVNVPLANYGQTGWDIFYSSNHFNQAYNHFVWGTLFTGTPSQRSMEAAAVGTIDAYLIDKKIDDGVHRTGFVLVDEAAGNTLPFVCITAGAGGTFNFTSTTPGCRLFFRYLP